MVAPQSVTCAIVSWPQVGPQVRHTLGPLFVAPSASEAVPCGLQPMETSEGPLPAWRSPLRYGPFRAGRKKSETKGDSEGRNSGRYHKLNRGNSSQAKLRARGMCCAGNTENGTTVLIYSGSVLQGCLQPTGFTLVRFKNAAELRVRSENDEPREKALWR